MNRALFSGSLICVVFLIVGTFVFPDNMIMSLASMSVAATIFRVLMALVLITVLFTSPPRRFAVRLTMGVMAGILLVGGLLLCFGNSMHLFDILLFLEMGCALGIEALEFNDDELEERTERLRDVYKSLSVVKSKV